jgi:hypothetical protein
MISENQILAALEAERNGDKFPNDFGDIWEYAGYSTKGNAIRFFKSLKGLKKGVHYIEHLSEVRKKAWNGRSSVSIKLSNDARKFFIAKSNTPEGDELLWLLIEVEKRFYAQLERLLNQTISDVPGYPHTLDDLWKDSGIVSRSQVQRAITRDFVEGKHYCWEGNCLQITEICYLILMLNLRSRKGSDISSLSTLIKIDKEELFQYGQRKKANCRNSKQEEYSKLEASGQLSLF